MGVHPFPAIDPASNYLTMTGGPGAAPMHAYSAAMTTLGTSGTDTVVSSALNTASTAASWSGLGQVRAAASVSELNGVVSDTSAKALLKAQLAQAAAELHTMTVARMVTHVQANANRAETWADYQINPLVFGALTPRIGELELEYAAMWANNAQAGVTYGAGLDTLGAGLAGLSALPSLAGGSVAAPAMAAAQIGETAAISGLGAAMSTVEQAATAAIAPATTAATTTASSSTAHSMLGSAPLAAPATPSSSCAPLAAVQTPAPYTPSPALSQAQAPVMGMFAPPPIAAVTPPAPSPAVPATVPPVTAAPPMPAAAPGVTSFVPPAQPFSPPPPSGGQAAGLKPGMLNAAALRGPVATLPLTTTAATSTLATSSLATATQPLAYVPPNLPQPTPVPPTPPQQPPLNPGNVAHTMTPPPPTPPNSPPPPTQLLTPPHEQQAPPPQPPQQPTAPPDQQPTLSVAPPQPSPPAAPAIGGSTGQGVQNLGGDLKDSPGAQALSVQNNADVHKIVDPLPPGEHKGVKVLPTPEQIDDLYNQLTQNATPLPPGTYGKGLGKWAQLPDGTRIGYRPNSEWGGPTVEIWDPGAKIPSVSVHLPERSTPEPQPAPEPAPQPQPVQTPATQTPAPETHEPAHDDSGHPSIHVDPPPPGVWATIVGILGVIGGVIGGIGEFAR
jgi:hypothetical protein